MGLENLKSIFEEDLNNSIDDFSSNVITNVDGTKFFSTPPQPPSRVATNPTDFSSAVGNNDLPFTPLNQLGNSFLDGLSWESLYNPNHSYKNDAGHKGLIPINYPNSNRDKLNIRNPDDGRFGFGGSFRTSAISAVGKLIGTVPFLEGDITEFIKDTGKEPYIVSTIPQTGSDLFSGRTINFGGRDFPIARSLTDSVRLAKFLTSPAGVLFIGKQNLLGLQQIPFTQDLNRTQLDNAGYKDFGAKFNLVYKPFYNPLSSLIATVGRAGGGPAGLIDKTEPGLAGLLGNLPGLDTLGLTDALDSPYPKFQNEYYPQKSQLAQILLGGRIVDTKKPQSLFKSNIGENKFGDDDSGIVSNKPYPKDLGLKSLNNTFKPINIDSDSGFDGDKHTLLSFGTTDSDVNDRTQYKETTDESYLNDLNGVENGMPFYFKDMRDGSNLVFRAYIEGLSENIAPSYNSTQYIGRSEPVYTYSQTERDVNFTLKLFAQSKTELAAIYEKMNKLTSLCYPEYMKDVNSSSGGELTSYGNRMKPPLTKMRIGDMYGAEKNELMGYLKSLSYTVDQTSPYEVEVGKRVPMHIIATIGYQVIHSTVPNLETQFYGYIGDGTIASGITT